MSGECERIEIFEEDSCRVTARFKFKDGTKYEVTSNTMNDRRDVERVKSSVYFKNCFSARKALEMYRKRIDVLVKDGIASFRTENKMFKYVCGEEDGELYCKFKIDNFIPLCISQFQAPTCPPPGRPPGFCTLLLPRGRDLYLMTLPGGRVLYIYKITFSTVKNYTFTQLAFGSYLHALHRQFRLSILA